MLRVYFHEDQYIRQSRIWLLIAVPIVVAVVSIATTPRMAAEAVAVTLVVGVLLIALFTFARLETEVRADSVVIQFHGLWPTRRIPLGDIEDVEARRYSILESGGWGVHLTLRGMAYNVSGNQGVFVRLRKGRSVLIGSQRATELAAAIRSARAGA